MKSLITKKFISPLTKRLAMGLSVVIVVLILIYANTLNFGKNNLASASTLGSSSINTNTGNAPQRKIVTTTAGKIFTAYNAGTQETPNNLVYRTSTDNGTTWSSSTQIDSDASIGNDFSMAIDSSNNIYIIFRTSTGTSFRKLTYSAGTWSTGSAVVLATNVTASCISHTAHTYNSPTIAVNSSGVIIVTFKDTITCAGSSFVSARSTDAVTFGQYTGVPVGTGGNYSPMMAIGADIWAVTNDGCIYKDIGATGSWTSTGVCIASSNFNSSNSSMASTGSNKLDFFYQNSLTSTLDFVEYTISLNSLGSVTTISSSTNDVVGSLSSDGTTLWATYQSYIAASSYDVVYKSFNGSTWSGSATNLTSNGLNNINVTAGAQSYSNSLLVLWSTGTTAPFTITTTAIATTITNSSPAAPTLLSPSSGQTGVSTSPLFQLRTTDADNDYLRYKVIVYASDCVSSPQTFDQTLSQNGWALQNQQVGTAYTGNSTIASSTVANFGLANLSANTTYCWKAAAIDPGGANAFGSFSSTQLFTTGAANSGVVNINGGANINGGTIVR